MPSLYLHYPFCVGKCRYCNFVSAPARDEREKELYIESLSRELSLAAMTPGIGGREIPTLYFGGGTPSLMPVPALEKLMVTIRNLFPVAPGAEITVECNPGSQPEPARWLSAARGLGVNRAVAGVQSFDDEALKFLGRPHNRAEAVDFLRAARAAGFDSVGIDLIYGLPGRTGDAWRRDLDAAVSLGPDHVSIYCLEITADTPLGRALSAGDFLEANPETQAGMYFAACEILESAGLRAYEISNFARPGHECRHNLVYWTGGDYLGAGLSACSHLGGWRWENERDIVKYKRKIAVGMLPRRFGEQLSPGRRLRERAIMALRTAAGFRLEPPRTDYERGLEADLDLLAESGALEKTATGEYRLPQRLRFVSDSVFSRIVG